MHSTLELRAQSASLAASEAAHLTVLERLNGGRASARPAAGARSGAGVRGARPVLGEDVTERTLPVGEAARQLGISLDTLRRWDRSGRIETMRDRANRRLVPESEIQRLRGLRSDGLSARNRFSGVVREVRIEGLLAQVELDVAGPAA